MHLNSSPTRPRRSLRLLSCHRSVEWLALLGLTTKLTTVCDIPRTRIKSAVIGLARLIWAQTGCGWVSCLSVSRLSKRQSSAIELHRDRRSVYRFGACSLSLNLRETAYLTRRAPDRRRLASRRPQTHRHRLAVRNWARCLSRPSRERHWQTTCQVDPMTRDRPLLRSRLDRVSRSSCTAPQTG